MKFISKIFIGFLLVLTLMLISNSACGQIKVMHFNAEWNKDNKVSWIKKLTDCKVSSVDIVENTKAKKKYKIVIVPTIVIFKDGEEVKRFQADLSFAMAATREEVQEYIDELIMSDF
tara:strand:+ start:810 stop:1160 length:351 start_codon:yes stop_codon:yes gene_type:complete